MQLVAYGAQDIYLTGNPVITYFKVVYRRHTNFALESIEQVFSGRADFGQKVSCLIARNGDLLHGLTLQATLPEISADPAIRWTENVGHYLIKEVSISIGGEVIDKHYSDWLEIWSQLTVPASKKRGYLSMIGQCPLDAIGQPGALQMGVTSTYDLYIPLQFWFCRNIGLALPLIALQYHEVNLDVTFETLPNLRMSNANPAVRSAITTGLTDVSLWADYIYLDTDERRRFAQISHEYLIEQLQLTENNIDSTSQTIDLHFNHPVKELLWVSRATASSAVNQWCNYTGSQADCSVGSIGNIITSIDADEAGLQGTVVTIDANEAFTTITTTSDASVANIAAIAVSKYFQTGGADAPELGDGYTRTAVLKLNNHERFAPRKGKYFNFCQPFKHHTCIPDSPGIYVYSFALKPEDHQPSGTCNFSRIDNAQLILTFVDTVPGVTKVFATNYNVLRIMSGMGGLAYSN